MGGQWRVVKFDPKTYRETTYPGEACGEDPPPGWVPLYMRPVKPIKARTSGPPVTEEIEGVVEAICKLISAAFWFTCFVGVKTLLDLPDALDRARAARERERQARFRK